LPASRLSRLNHYPQFKEQKKMPLLLRVSDIAECSGVIHSPPSSQIKKLQFSQDFSQPFIRPFFTFPTVLAGLAKAYSLTHGLSQDVSVSFHTLTTCFYNSCREIPVYPNSDARQALFMKILSKFYRKP
jgi:hypothetical protein